MHGNKMRKAMPRVRPMRAGRRAMGRPVRPMRFARPMGRLMRRRSMR